MFKHFFFFTFCVLTFFSAEPPSLTAQPTRKIFAELDRNVDIPCLATGTLHTYLHCCFTYFQACLKAILACQYMYTERVAVVVIILAVKIFS